MTYDEALLTAEGLVRELEVAEALSLEEYRKKAAEVSRLLAFCRKELGVMEREITEPGSSDQSGE